MKAYKNLTIITAIIAVAAFIGAVLMHYVFPCIETDFWINVCLSIFGSAVLTALTSIVSYNHEKVKTLESFLYHTRQILSFLNKYQESMSLEQKLKFFLDYHELDKIAWDADYGNMSFFLEFKTRNQKYIYDRIYMPIVDFNNAVANHVWHFRWHLDGSGKNETVMQDFVAELQSYLLEKTEKDIPTEYSDNGEPTAYCHWTSTEPKLVFEIKKELAGRYYEILYGKRIARKELKSEEDNGNG